MSIKQKKGISLIVLVITIIVMIILASTIILSLNNSGIIEKTNKAKNNTEISNAKGLISVANAEWLLMTEEEQTANGGTFKVYVNDKLQSAGYSAGTTEPGSYHVTVDGEIYKYPVIPEGFVVSGIASEQTLEGGLVVYEIPESNRSTVSWTETVTVNSKTILKVQNEYNQYVWVPVPDINGFKAKDWGKGITGTDFKTNLKDYDLNIAAEANEYAAVKESVEKYGGFYIARYEAGKPSDTVNYGQTEGTVLSIPVSKKGVAVWNNIPWDANWTSSQTTNVYGTWENPGAPRVARNAYNTNVKSHLIYGAEWDAALNFISKTDSTYATNTTGRGWYSNNYSSGNADHKTGIDVDSNASNRINNIYDMSGNVWEWTMEIAGFAPDPCRGERGGSFNDREDEPASCRFGYLPYFYVDNLGFRLALYIK